MDADIKTDKDWNANTYSSRDLETITTPASLRFKFVVTQENLAMTENSSSKMMKKSNQDSSRQAMSTTAVKEHLF